MEIPERICATDAFVFEQSESANSSVPRVRWTQTRWQRWLTRSNGRYCERGTDESKSSLCSDSDASVAQFVNSCYAALAARCRATASAVPVFCVSSDTKMSVKNPSGTVMIAG